MVPAMSGGKVQIFCFSTPLRLGAWNVGKAHASLPERKQLSLHEFVTTFIVNCFETK